MLPVVEFGGVVTTWHVRSVFRAGSVHSGECGEQLVDELCSLHRRQRGDPRVEVGRLGYHPTSDPGHHDERRPNPLGVGLGIGSATGTPALAAASWASNCETRL